MNLIKPGGEHTIDLDLVPKEPDILDVGSRDFQFDIELLKLRPGGGVIAFDPDPSIVPPDDIRIMFHNTAITEKATEVVKWQGPGEGAYICGKPGDPGYGWGPRNDSVDVANMTIKQVQDKFRVLKFDVIKLDCEGSEFGIMENWPGPIATQISVEFHDFVDRNRWNDAYFERLFAGPLRDYKVVQFGLTPLGPGNSMGHWDTLLVLK